MGHSPFGEETLSALAPLLREVVDLKRVRTAAGGPRSLAEQCYQRAWRALLGGGALESVAHTETARALVATRLAGVDAGVLAEHGLPPPQRRRALRRAFRDAAAPVAGSLADRLEAVLVEGTGDDGGAPQNQAGASTEAQDGSIPSCVSALLRQPRAGVTCPGQPRLVLHPPESHADHCASVAVIAALLAPVVDADPGEVFFVGLAHHLHNGTLPDAGHAGDVLLGTAKQPLLEAARARALGELPPALAERAKAAWACTEKPPSGPEAPPAAQAFHAADALDRVLEIAWHARTARFTLEEALDDMNLVHEGPEQAFQEAVLAEAGITPPDDRTSQTR